ncbi:MAG: hypothetical protein LBJ67_12020 [Planctomycetaceae bacterium]|nr:hypothetical protein [Planctomycetaceae bacterium]
MIRPTMQFHAIFGGTTIPSLEQVAVFNEARQNLLAGNIANFDTPGSKMRDMDVGKFKNDLADAIQQKHEPGSPAEIRYPLKSSSMTGGGTWPQDIPILQHDHNNIGMEYQVTEMAKNSMEFNSAISIMKHQMNLLQTSISERV